MRQIALRRNRRLPLGSIVLAGLAAQAGFDGGVYIWAPDHHGAPLLVWSDPDRERVPPDWVKHVPLPLLTTIALTATASSPWSMTPDFNGGANTIEGIGGGQGGEIGGASSAAGGRGGHGGDYCRLSNFNAGATTAYVIGTAGAAQGTHGSALNGGDTTWNVSSLVAPGGGSATAFTGPAAHFTGGGTITPTGTGGAGGSGAAGPAGNGGAGANTTMTHGGGGGGNGGGGSAVGVGGTGWSGATGGTTGSASVGGPGSNGSGGGGGDTRSSATAGFAGGAGSKGLDWSGVSAGSGGAPGGGGSNSRSAGGNGGAGGAAAPANTGAGGAGGGGCAAASTAGVGTAGATGLIIITYAGLWSTMSEGTRDPRPAPFIAVGELPT